jgi:hypothetical protein
MRTQFCETTWDAFSIRFHLFAEDLFTTKIPPMVRIGASYENRVQRLQWPQLLLSSNSLIHDE